MKENINILILEDNEDCYKIYEDLLNKSYQLTPVKKIEGLKEIDLTKIKYDLFIADLKLPDGVFLEWVIESNSKIMEQIPTMVISSMDDLDILRNCFQWGAVDYLVKPFRPNELVAKVEKILFSKTYPIENIDQFQNTLTLSELKIFQIFYAHKDTPLARDFIVRSIWKKVSVDSKTLDVHLSNIRRKMVGTHWKIETLGVSSWKLTQLNEQFTTHNIKQ